MDASSSQLQADEDVEPQPPAVSVAWHSSPNRLLQHPDQPTLRPPAQDGGDPESSAALMALLRSSGPSKSLQPSRLKRGRLSVVAGEVAVPSFAAAPQLQKGIGSPAGSSKKARPEADDASAASSGSVQSPLSIPSQQVRRALIPGSMAVPRDGGQSLAPNEAAHMLELIGQLQGAYCARHRESEVLARAAFSVGRPSGACSPAQHHQPAAAAVGAGGAPLDFGSRAVGMHLDGGAVASSDAAPASELLGREGREQSAGLVMAAIAAIGQQALIALSAQASQAEQFSSQDGDERAASLAAPLGTRPAAAAPPHQQQPHSSSSQAVELDEFLLTEPSGFDLLDMVEKSAIAAVAALHAEDAGAQPSQHAPILAVGVGAGAGAALPAPPPPHRAGSALSPQHPRVASIVSAVADAAFAVVLRSARRGQRSADRAAAPALGSLEAAAHLAHAHSDAGCAVAPGEGGGGLHVRFNLPGSGGGGGSSSKSAVVSRVPGPGASYHGALEEECADIPSAYAASAPGDAQLAAEVEAPLAPFSSSSSASGGVVCQLAFPPAAPRLAAADAAAAGGVMLAPAAEAPLAAGVGPLSVASAALPAAAAAAGGGEEEDDFMLSFAELEVAEAAARQRVAEVALSAGSGSQGAEPRPFASAVAAIVHNEGLVAGGQNVITPAVAAPTPAAVAADGTDFDALFGDTMDFNGVDAALLNGTSSSAAAQPVGTTMGPVAAPAGPPPPLPHAASSPAPEWHAEVRVSAHEAASMLGVLAYPPPPPLPAVASSGAPAPCSPVFLRGLVTGVSSVHGAPGPRPPHAAAQLQLQLQVVLRVAYFSAAPAPPPGSRGTCDRPVEGALPCISTCFVVVQEDSGALDLCADAAGAIIHVVAVRDGRPLYGWEEGAGAPGGMDGRLAALGATAASRHPATPQQHGQQQLLVHPALLSTPAAAVAPAAELALLGGAGVPAPGPFLLCVSDSRNVLILHPDLLMAPTKIAGAAVCLRRAVLGEIMGDAGGQDGGNSKVPLYGQLKHDLFEVALNSAVIRLGGPGMTEERRAAAILSLGGELQAVASALVRAPLRMEELYAVGEEDDAAVAELRGVIPGVLDWLRRFVWPGAAAAQPATAGGAGPAAAAPPCLAVTRIVATEDELWSPVWGLKGIVDATLEVRLQPAGPARLQTALSFQPQQQQWQQGGRPGAVLRCIPLELKTGRRPREGSSVEHRAQVALYALLMAERYGDRAVGGGLGTGVAPPLGSGKSSPGDPANLDLGQWGATGDPAQAGGLLVYLSSPEEQRSARDQQSLLAQLAQLAPQRQGAPGGSGGAASSSSAAVGGAPKPGPPSITPQQAGSLHSTTLLPALWPEQRSLLGMRNQLAAALVRARSAAPARPGVKAAAVVAQPSPSSSSACGAGEVAPAPQLPPLIQDERVCGRCYAFAACASTYACRELPDAEAAAASRRGAVSWGQPALGNAPPSDERATTSGGSESSGIGSSSIVPLAEELEPGVKKQFVDAMAHLRPSHRAYFRRWMRLIDIEGAEVRAGRAPAPRPGRALTGRLEGGPVADIEDVVCTASSAPRATLLGQRRSLDGRAGIWAQSSAERERLEGNTVGALTLVRQCRQPARPPPPKPVVLADLSEEEAAEEHGEALRDSQQQGASTQAQGGQPPAPASAHPPAECGSDFLYTFVRESRGPGGAPPPSGKQQQQLSQAPGRLPSFGELDSVVRGRGLDQFGELDVSAGDYVIASRDGRAGGGPGAAGPSMGPFALMKGYVVCRGPHHLTLRASRDVLAMHGRGIMAAASEAAQTALAVEAKGSWGCKCGAGCLDAVAGFAGLTQPLSPAVSSSSSSSAPAPPPTPWAWRLDRGESQTISNIEKDNLVRLLMGPTLSWAGAREQGAAEMGRGCWGEVQAEDDGGEEGSTEGPEGWPAAAAAAADLAKVHTAPLVAAPLAPAPPLPSPAPAPPPASHAPLSLAAVIATFAEECDDEEMMMMAAAAIVEGGGTRPALGSGAPVAAAAAGSGKAAGPLAPSTSSGGGKSVVPLGRACGDLKRQALIVDLAAPRFLSRPLFPWSGDGAAAREAEGATAESSSACREAAAAAAGDVRRAVRDLGCYVRTPPDAPSVQLLKREFGGAGAPFPAPSSAGLNDDQRAAVTRVLQARDYVCLLGMPGTGKTSTIAFLVRCCVALGRSVLITSYTHTAVDTLLLKLLDSCGDSGGAAGGDLRILRLGAASKVHPRLAGLTLEGAVMSGEVDTIAAVAARLRSAHVVGATCLGVRHPIFSQRTFDVCIVDEASQIKEPVCLGPLRTANLFVLVGDHHQLPPLVRAKEARGGGLGVSLFRRLSEAHPAAVAPLTSQYRMNEDIQALANGLVYEGALRCGNRAVAEGRYRLPAPDRLPQPALLLTPTAGQAPPRPSLAGGRSWLSLALDPATTVCLLDTDAAVRAAEEEVEGARGGVAGPPAPWGDCPAIPSGGNGDRVQQSNPTEARVVATLVAGILVAGGHGGDIGVISPYRAQLRLLRATLDGLMLRLRGGASPAEGAPAAAGEGEVEIETVDRYQGRDKPVIVFSLSRYSPTDGDVGALLTDIRRLNVAITRAKYKLVIVGSKSTLLAAAAAVAGASASMKPPAAAAVSQQEQRQQQLGSSQLAEIRGAAALGSLVALMEQHGMVLSLTAAQCAEGYFAWAAAEGGAAAGVLGGVGTVPTASLADAAPAAERRVEHGGLVAAAPGSGTTATGAAPAVVASVAGAATLAAGSEQQEEGRGLGVTSCLCVERAPTMVQGSGPLSFSSAFVGCDGEGEDESLIMMMHAAAAGEAAMAAISHAQLLPQQVAVPAQLVPQPRTAVSAGEAAGGAGPSAAPSWKHNADPSSSHARVAAKSAFAAGVAATPGQQLRPAARSSLSSTARRVSIAAGSTEERVVCGFVTGQQGAPKPITLSAAALKRSRSIFEAADQEPEAPPPAAVSSSAAEGAAHEGSALHSAPRALLKGAPPFSRTPAPASRLRGGGGSALPRYTSPPPPKPGPAAVESSSAAAAAPRAGVNASPFWPHPASTPGAPAASAAGAAAALSRPAQCPSGDGVGPASSASTSARPTSASAEASSLSRARGGAHTSAEPPQLTCAREAWEELQPGRARNASDEDSSSPGAEEEEGSGPSPASESGRPKEALLHATITPYISASSSAGAAASMARMEAATVSDGAAAGMRTPAVSAEAQPASSNKPKKRLGSAFRKIVRAPEVPPET